MYDMFNIFDIFLPQLLRYPNPNDPLNGEAAALLNRSADEYNTKVKDYVRRYATSDALGDDKKDEDEELDEMSDLGRWEPFFFLHMPDVSNVYDAASATAIQHEIIPTLTSLVPFPWFRYLSSFCPFPLTPIIDISTSQPVSFHVYKLRHS
jgi:hypothetical protein